MFLYKMKEDKKRYRNQKYEGSNHHHCWILSGSPQNSETNAEENLWPSGRRNAPRGPRLNAMSTILKRGITKHRTLLGKHHSWVVTVAITVMIDR